MEDLCLASNERGRGEEQKEGGGEGEGEEQNGGQRKGKRVMGSKGVINILEMTMVDKDV